MYVGDFTLLRDEPPWVLANTFEEQRQPGLRLVSAEGERRLGPGVKGVTPSRGGEAALAFGAEGVARLASPGLEAGRWIDVGFPVEGAAQAPAAWSGWGEGWIVWGGAKLAWVRPLSEELRSLPAAPGVVRELLALAGERIVALLEAKPGEPGAAPLTLGAEGWGEALTEPWLGGVVLEGGEALLLVSALRAEIARWRPGESPARFPLNPESMGVVRFYACAQGRAIVEGWEGQLWWADAHEGLVAEVEGLGELLGVDASCRRAVVGAGGQLDVHEDGVRVCGVPWSGPMPRVHLAGDRLTAALPMRAESWDLKPPGTCRASQFEVPGRRAQLREDGRVVTLDDALSLRLRPPPEDWNHLSWLKLAEAKRRPEAPPPAGEVPLRASDADAAVDTAWFSAPGLSAEQVLAALRDLGGVVEPAVTHTLYRQPCGLDLRLGWFHLFGAEPWVPELLGALTRALGRPLEVLKFSALGGLNHHPPCTWGARAFRRSAAAGELEGGPVAAWVETLDTDRVAPARSHAALVYQLYGEARTQATSLLQRSRRAPTAYGAWTVRFPESPLEAEDEPGAELPDAGPSRLRWVAGELSFAVGPRLERALLEKLSASGVLDREAAPPDLSRWAPRVLRRLGLEAEPEVGSAEREAWTALWLRMTRKDRAQELSGGRRVPAWKLTAPGQWELSAAELVTLGEQLALMPGASAEAARAWIGERERGCSALVTPAE